MTPRKRKPTQQQAVPRTIVAALAGMLHRAGPIEAAVGGLVLVSGLLLLRIHPGVRSLLCGPEPRQPADAILTKVAPAEPLPGQARPPCDHPGEARRGGCWMAAREANGAQATNCIKSETLWEMDGLCWLPMFPKEPRRLPSASDVKVVPL